MSLRTMAGKAKRSLRDPVGECRRTWFQLTHARRPVHDLLCRGDGFVLKIRSDSVLAEPLYARSGFEEAEARLLRSLVKPAMTVFDVGANVGLYTVMLGKAVGPAGRVYSFEPFPPVAAYLRDNVVLNHLSNATIVQKAVAEREGQLEFQVFPEGSDVYNSLGARVRPVEHLEAVRVIPVEVTTLDAYAREQGIDHIDILKIDVEGAEERAFSGAADIIQRSPSLAIVAELWEPSAIQCGCSPKRMVETLESWGFRSFIIDPLGMLAPADAQALAPGNYLFRRGV